MSEDDGNTHPPPLYHLRSDPRPVEAIPLPLRSYRRRHNRTPSSSSSGTRSQLQRSDSAGESIEGSSDSGFGATTGYQVPIPLVLPQPDLWSPIATPGNASATFVLQQATSPAYSMEGSGSSSKIEKFSGRPGTVTLREFKATFYTIVYELELKFKQDFTNAFAFKQLARYVHHEALDVYQQYSPQLLSTLQVPNPAYAAAIAGAQSTTLQATIAAHNAAVAASELGEDHAASYFHTAEGGNPQDALSTIAEIEGRYPKHY
ncbi:unnamed protein product [Calypogeia fissa]